MARITDVRVIMTFRNGGSASGLFSGPQILGYCGEIARGLSSGGNITFSKSGLGAEDHLLMRVAIGGSGIGIRILRPREASDGDEIEQFSIPFAEMSETVRQAFNATPAPGEDGKGQAAKAVMAVMRGKGLNFEETRAAVESLKRAVEIRAMGEDPLFPNQSGDIALVL